MNPHDETGQTPDSPEEALFHQLADLTEDQRAESLAAIADPAIRLRLGRLLAAAGETPGARIPLDVSVWPLLEKADEDLSGAVFGNYTIVYLLGEGGMGRVYKAFQGHPVKREVALKVVKSSLNSLYLLDRFQQELRVLGRLKHPNIAYLIDAGIAPSGSPFFVMELVDGLPLTRYCEEQNLPLNERIAIFRAVCRGVHHAHRKGVIHRDIKPNNVLVSGEDGPPVPKIIDFGVAKVLGGDFEQSEGRTALGMILGTPNYMSPEQAAAGAEILIDHRTDVYSLGALLYELVCGSPPLDLEAARGKGLEEMLRVLREDEPQPPLRRLQEDAARHQRAGFSSARDVRKRTRRELDWIISRSIAKSPSRRYEDARELDEDLGRYLAGDQPKALPPGRWRHLRKWHATHRVSIRWAALLMVVLLASTAFARHQMNEARLEAKREAALKAKKQAHDLLITQEAAGLLPYFRDSYWPKNESSPGPAACEGLWKLSKASLETKRRFVELAVEKPEENYGMGSHDNMIFNAIAPIDADFNLHEMITSILRAPPASAETSDWYRQWHAHVASDKISRQEIPTSTRFEELMAWLDPADKSMPTPEVEVLCREMDQGQLDKLAEFLVGAIAREPKGYLPPIVGNLFCKKLPAKLVGGLPVPS